MSKYNKAINDWVHHLRKWRNIHHSSLSKLRPAVWVVYFKLKNNTTAFTFTIKLGDKKVYFIFKSDRGHRMLGHDYVNTDLINKLSDSVFNLISKKKEVGND